MYVGKIEAAEEIQLLLPENQPEPRRGHGRTLLGIGFLLIAIPYWSVRLIGGALWRDVSRAGRVAKIAGETYGDALKRR